ncbi:MAG: hypothetical protein PHH08_03365 [Candidatus ainarchaeum sp.]|nr:hypothetical protein [Candidatus ainarchaeum sp.]
MNNAFLFPRTTKIIPTLILLAIIATSAGAQTCVNLPTLMTHITDWKTGNIAMPALIQKITDWKAGTNCTPQGGGLTPVARWDMVPYQRINAGETLNLGVIAFSKNGIEKIEFSITGQGYSGGTKTATTMALNPQTNVWEYWVPLSANEFSSDGTITIEATATGKDGGIRNKTTGGGGLGLDALTFNVNPNNGLPQPAAWVDIRGNDETGAVNDSAKPFRTIGRAVDGIRLWKQSNGYANNSDGGIVRLNPGDHNMENGRIWSEIPMENEWVTITTAAGGNKANTSLRNGNGGTPRLKLLKIEGITLKSSATNNFAVYNQLANASIWIDKSDLIGPGRYVEAGYTIMLGPNQSLYYTDDYFTALDFAVAGAKIARNVTIEHIGEDAFRQTSLIANSRADDLSPDIADLAGAVYTAHGHPSGHENVIEKTGAFSNYTWAARDRVYTGTTWANDNCSVGGKISSDAIWILPDNCSNGRGRVWASPDGDIDATLWTNGHSDGLQWWGPGSNSQCSSLENTIVYNTRITNAKYQLMWTDGFETCTEAAGIAFVNNYLEGYSVFTWARPAQQLLWWQNSIKADRIYIRQYSIPNFSGTGNLINGPLIDLSGGTIDYSGWAYNHYTFTGYTPNGTAISPGNPSFTGAAGIDSYGRPLPNSPLIGKVSTIVVPADAEGSLRNTSGTSIGAYEYAGQ